MAQQRLYTKSIEDQWEVSDDDEFMRSNLRTCLLPLGKPNLCGACRMMDISSPEISFARDTLVRNYYEETCALCGLIYSVLGVRKIWDSENIVFTRTVDSFVLRGTEQKLLRLCRTGDDATEDAKGIPFGAPTLVTLDFTTQGRQSLFKLLKAWLQNCDTQHSNTCAPRNRTEGLPKRLINVENRERPRIIDTEEMKMDPQEVDYVALSHRLSNIPKDAETTEKNLENRKRKIPSNKLPLSFKEVIAMTNNFGIKYLWIDSLCTINEGRNGESADQTDTTDTTFSGAYCVIAVCDSGNAAHGFLGDRVSDCAQMGNIFISNVTNDFERDVLRSVLNHDGWLMQLRALARRTIFANANQMYWECGDGIRCETLAKLKRTSKKLLSSAVQ